MKIKEVLKKQVEKIKLNDKELREIDKKTDEFCGKLRKEIKKRKIKAEVFVGGSLAKKTILKRDKYDIDIFIRFDKKYKDSEISVLLGKVLKGRKVHGSRDYYQIKIGKVLFEVIPVIKISKPENARNVTDLSYFHVSYIMKKINERKKLINEILLAKSFCHAQNCYGAESYIRGFSGYALELLVIYYKGFLFFFKAISKFKEKKKIKIVIDLEKHYKNKNQIMLELNESKLSSPVVFIDPTYKERNVLAGLSEDTVLRFKETCIGFLRKPSEKFFEKTKIKEKDYNLILKVKTNRQEGDIAGSKLFKFYKLLERELEKYFEIKKKDFEYDYKKTGTCYFNIKQRKEIIIPGPPITTIENVTKFRKKHKKVFKKNHRVYAREKSVNIKKFVSDFKNNNKIKMKNMGITGLI